MRDTSALSIGVRPLRALFREEREGGMTHWYCRLCPYSYFEFLTGTGWPLSVDGLFILTKHLRGHQHT